MPSSSDEEFEEPTNPWAHVGASVIDAILDDRDARKRSKKESKELTVVYGAPGTQRMRAYWRQAWTTFTTSKLLKNAETVRPSGEDIERFLLSQPRYMKANAGGRTELAYTTIAHGLKHVLQEIKVLHDNFKLTDREKRRIKAVFHKLLEQKLITHEPAREKRWIGSKLTLRMCTSLLEEAVQRGVSDWSVTVSQCLSLATSCTLVTRAGDISKSIHYDDNKVLQYRDIVLTICSPDTEMDDVQFKAWITLRFIKGYKANGSKNETMVVESLKDSNHRPICMLALLITQALRTGNVKDCSSIDDVLRTTLQRRDKTVQWVEPNRPVLSAFKTGPYLEPTRSAAVDQLRKTLNHAAASLGITQTLWTHDIRRGGAQEMSEIAPIRNIDNAAEALKHSARATMAGITRAYTGIARKTTFAERLELEDVYSHPRLMVDVDEDAPKNKKQKRIDTTTIDTFLADPANIEKLKNAKTSRSRRAAATRLIRANGEETTTPTANAMDDVLSPQPTPSIATSEGTSTNITDSTDQSRRKSGRSTTATTPDLTGPAIEQNDVVYSVISTSSSASATTKTRKKPTPTAKITAFVNDPANAGKLSKCNTIKSRRAAAARFIEQTPEDSTEDAAMDGSTLVELASQGDNVDGPTEVSNDVNYFASLLEGDTSMGTVPGFDIIGSQSGFMDFEDDDPSSLFIPKQPAIDSADTIDPQLLMISDLVLRAGTGEELTGEEADGLDFALDIAQSQETPSTTSLLNGSIINFIDKLSRINIHRDGGGPAAAAVSIKRGELLGGSKDQPTMFEAPCKNANLGCPYKDPATSKLLEHEAGCTPERIALLKSHQEARVSGKFVKSCPDCDRVFRGAAQFTVDSALLRHQQQEHDARVFRCTKSTSSNCNKDFPTENALHNHNTDLHSIILPVSCPLDAAHTKQYDKWFSLRAHLRRSHAVRGKDISKIHSGLAAAKRKRDASQGVEEDEAETEVEAQVEEDPDEMNDGDGENEEEG
ncbi:Hypothetical protein D9617_36g063290 [Elsinoe fawcettii]|nr:Hypothetical protein D9617_36g063290 [Elsinoe fawcettii]